MTQEAQKMAVRGTKGCKCTSPDALCKQKVPQGEPDKIILTEPVLIEEPTEKIVEKVIADEGSKEPAEEKGDVIADEVIIEPSEEIVATPEEVQQEPISQEVQLPVAETIAKVQDKPGPDIQQAEKDGADKKLEPKKPAGKATCDCTMPNAPCKKVGAVPPPPPPPPPPPAEKSLAPPIEEMAVQGLSKCLCPSEGSPCRVTTINWDICQGTYSDDATDGVEPDLGALLLDKELLADGPTVNELQASIAVMEKKCRVKDQLITALTDELHLHSNSGVFENLLSNVCTDPYTTEDPPRDFDRDLLCEFLKRPENYSARPPPHHLEPFSADGRKVGCPSTCPGIKDCVKDSRPAGAIPCPAGLKVHRRVGQDGLLLGWNVPQDADFVGYEIYVNGVLKQKVRSPSRNKALLQNLDLIHKVVITMYGLTIAGRTSEPSCVIYPDPDAPELSKSPCKCT